MPKTDENNWEYEDKPEAICPYCDIEFNDEDFMLLEEGTHKIDCPECNKQYIVETTEIKDFTFSTFTKEEQIW